MIARQIYQEILLLFNGVMNDPLNQTHSPVISYHYFHLKIENSFVLRNFEKWG